MSLGEEYRRQRQWRDWETALRLCPIQPGQRVLDLGCGPGDVSRELAWRGARVTGVDQDETLLALARSAQPQGCEFVAQDLRSLALPRDFDGLWCSFAAAYFPDLAALLSNWALQLKADAWICLVEIDDLFGHEPLASGTRTRLEKYYASALAAGRYDFRMGRRTGPVLRQLGFRTTTVELADAELSFDGPAPPLVRQAWAERLDRMKALQEFMGPGFREEFLDCLSSAQHRSRAKVICSVGLRG